MDQHIIIEAIKRFDHLNIMVVGDVILDAYYRGEVSRISPEAPVPILDVKSREFRLGGAANVAMNIKGLGARCIVCSVIGTDEPGQKVQALLEDENLPTTGLLISSDRPTSVKTRLVSGHSQLMRINEESTDALTSGEQRALTERILHLIDGEQVDAIVFEDYDKGVLAPSLIDSVIKKAREKGIPVTADPKRNNFFSYNGVSLFKPNMKELREGLNLPGLEPDIASLRMAYESLRKRMPIEIAMFTLSDKGIFITDGSDHHFIEAHKRTIADVSGAGDTVIATATCALAMNLGIEEVATLSNLAGGWVCQFSGVVSITGKDLIQEVQNLI